MLANARSEVLVDHCLASNAGLFYADRHEFVECLDTLVGDERLRAALGRNGRDYVRKDYRWDVVLGKYERMIASAQKVGSWQRLTVGGRSAELLAAGRAVR